MAGDAEDTLRRFWEIQNDRDYTKLADLFAEDAVFVDPMFGTFTGAAAIADFLERVTVEMDKIGARFDLEDLAGENEVVWAQWKVTTNDGERSGVGVYKVKDSKITYYRDYMNPAT